MSPKIAIVDGMVLVQQMAKMAQSAQFDLTEYLAEAVLKSNANSQKLVITSTSHQHTRSKRSIQFEENNHEEADTVMICLAASASQKCPTARMVFFSPDTGILVYLWHTTTNSARTLQYR